MPISRYGGITGSKKISEDFDNINTAFNNVATEADANKATVDGHIANGNLHTTLAEKTKLAGITAGAGGAGSATDTVIGNRTITDTTAPTGDTGTITTLLGWLANMIKAITGKSSWRTAPATTLEAANTHMNNSDLHTSVAEHTKLAGIQAGAEVNQKAFSQVNNIPAGDKSDTLTVTGGTGITVTNNPATKTMIVTATGTAAPGAHASSHLTGGSDPIPVATITTPGLMSAADKSRWDTESLTSINLVAGQQILNATKNARLQGLKVQGRTLINSNGKDGEMVNAWLYTATSGALESIAGFNLMRLSLLSGTDGNMSKTLKLDQTKHHIIIAVLANYNAAGGINFRYFNGSSSKPAATNNYVGGEIKTHFIKLAPADLGSSQALVVDIKGNAGQSGYIGAIRIFSISETDYAAIDSMTPEQVAQRWPYVLPGINGVDGLWVRRYGKNLLPSVPDTLHANAKMNGPYDMVLNATANSQSSLITMTAQPNTAYFISGAFTASTGAATLNIFSVDANGAMTYVAEVNNAVLSRTFNTPASCVALRFNLFGTVAGTFTFKDWFLKIGSTAETFQPREDSLIAFGGVELHANPTDGSDPYILREVNGRYEVTRRYRKIVLDGSLPWTYHDVSSTGYKQVRVPILNSVTDSNYVTKFDGRAIPYAYPITTGDKALLSQGWFYLSIFSIDSGWGDSYTPTSDEINAYFNGWRMFTDGQPAATNVYSGTGAKAWAKKNDAGGIVAASGVSVVPLTSNDSLTGRYQLLYRLATPTMETVQEDGSLSLLEGENFIEVGSGYVSREPARPKKNALSDVYYIGLNDVGNGGDSSLKKRASEIKQVFKNGLPDFWNIDKLADGTRYAWTDRYDTTASYSVSYIKLDKSPVSGVTGFYAATEKGQLRDLTDGVTEALARVSVVEAKKAEKDAGPWITPSGVLSGFTAFDLAYRVNKGFIEFRGYVYYSAADVPAGTKIFNLPAPFRPVRISRMLTSSWTSKVDPTASAVAVSLNGDITTEVNVKQNIVFDGLRFPLD